MAVVTATMQGNWTGPASELQIESGGTNFRTLEDGSVRTTEGSPVEFGRATATVSNPVVTATMLGSWGLFAGAAEANIEVHATGVAAWGGWDASMVVETVQLEGTVFMAGLWDVVPGQDWEWHMQGPGPRRKHKRPSRLEDMTEDRHLSDPLDWFRRHLPRGV